MYNAKLRMKTSIHSKVENGKLKTNRKALSEAIEQYNGKEITITIQRKKKTRSNLQNAFYWGCVVPIFKAAIYEQWGERQSTQEIHEFLKQNLHFIEKVNESTGEIIRLAKSTTVDSTVDFMVYLEEIRKFGKEWFGIDVPEPNEQISIEL